MIKKGYENMKREGGLMADLVEEQQLKGNYSKLNVASSSDDLRDFKFIWAARVP